MRSGGVLRVGMDLVSYAEGTVRAEHDVIWDPHGTWTEETSELFRCCLVRTLMSYNGRPVNEGGVELRPDLAEDLPTISADGLTWTFRLRDNVFYAPPFEDTPIVAADFIRALERAMRPHPGFSMEEELFPYAEFGVVFDVIDGVREFTAGQSSAISGLEAQDARTLVVHLREPAGDLGARLSFAAASPIPAGALLHDTRYGLHLAASGPYMIKGSDQLDAVDPRAPPVGGYVPGQSLTLVRNPSWKQGSDRLRSAQADRIEITQFNDYAEGVQAVLDDRLDVLLATPLEPEDVVRFRSDASLASRLHVTPAFKASYIMLNIAAPPFDDVHVRRAVRLATDRRELVAILDPTARVLRHAIPDAFQNGLLFEYDPIGTPDGTADLNRAGAEMALSKYDADGDGVCDDQACAIRLPTFDEPEPNVEAARAFADQLAPLGMTVTIDHPGFDEMHALLYDPALHNQIAFNVRWGADYIDGSNWFGPLAAGASFAVANHSLVGAAPDALAEWGYAVSEVPTLDPKIASCQRLTGAAAFTCWAEADQYLMDRIAAWIPLANTQQSRLVSSRVRQFNFDASLAMPALSEIGL